MSDPVSSRMLRRTEDPDKRVQRKALRKRNASLLKTDQDVSEKPLLPEGLMKFSFAYLSDDPHYGLLCLARTKDGSEKERTEALISCLEKISRVSWPALEQLGKFRGGPEVLPDGAVMHHVLLKQIEEAGLLKSGQLLSLRFGREEYRLMAWHSDEQPDTLWVLGADWDHSLYNHGS